MKPSLPPSGCSISSPFPVPSSARCRGGRREEGLRRELELTQGGGGEEFWGGAERPVQVLSQSPEGCPSQAEAWSAGCTWGLITPQLPPVDC